MQVNGRDKHGSTHDNTAMTGWRMVAARTASTYLSLLTDGAFFQVGWSWSELNT